MLPMVHRLENEFWGPIDFVYLNREAPENRDVTQQFGISYQPVFVLLDENGNEVQRWFGSQTEETLRSDLTAYLATLQ
ncbi:MAG: thioredoxin family protein [Chloroflexi bacterium]|nr:thioredoxin family protein [Chloroflexota bacterium]